MEGANLIRPPRVTVVLDDGTELEVPFRLGLDADLSGLRPDDDERQRDARTSTVKKKL